MKLNDYKYTGKDELHLNGFPTGADGKDKAECLEKTRKNQEAIVKLQERLYADGREGLIIVLQALDAAGKDSTIKHVMAGVNPQGVEVYSFKSPSSTESRHDYLWRIASRAPERGKIAIFNRSHYEEVLIVKVENLYKNYQMPKRVIDDQDFFTKRYRQIRDFEEYLYENGIRTLKFFLNVSKDEQCKRFLERIDKPDKHWKFELADLKNREKFDAYRDAFEDAINATATEHSPWYVLPADNKWYTRYLVSKAIRNALEEIDPQFPTVEEDELDDYATARALLRKQLPEKKRVKADEEAAEYIACAPAPDVSEDVPENEANKE